MMDIPISGPLYIYGGNMSVLHNTSRSESVLRKKSKSVCYHAVFESVAMGESLVEPIPSKENVADLMTKSYMDARGDIWSEIFFMIYMMNISHQNWQGKICIQSSLIPLVIVSNLRGLN